MTAPTATTITAGFSHTQALSVAEVLWYTFSVDNAPCTVTISTVGSDFDTYLDLYTSDGQYGTFDDDGGGSGTSLITNFSLSNGQYYIAVSGYGGTHGPVFNTVGGEESGNLVFNVTGDFTGGATYTATATPESGAAPLAVTFEVTSSGGDFTAAWDFGDGNTSASNPVSHTYSAPGTYDPSLTVSTGGDAPLYIFNMDTTVDGDGSVPAYYIDSRFGADSVIVADDFGMQSTSQSQFGDGSFAMATQFTAGDSTGQPFPSMTNAGLTSQQITFEFSTQRQSHAAGFIGPLINLNFGTDSQFTMDLLTDFPGAYEVVFNTPSDSNLVGAQNVPTNFWTQWALTFDLVNNVYRIFMNGVQLTSGDQILYGGDGIWPAISSSDAISFDFKMGPMDVESPPQQTGWIDEVRLTNSILYTDDYAPPTAAFALPGGSVSVSVPEITVTPNVQPDQYSTIIPPATMTIAQPTAIMPYPSILPSYVVIPVTITVWTMLDMATRAWGAEYNAPDKDIYVFSNGRSFDSTDLSRNGVYGVIGDDGLFATLLIDNGYDDMQTELLTDNVSISSPPNVGNPAQQNPETWQDVYELFANQ